MLFTHLGFFFFFFFRSYRAGKHFINNIMDLDISAIAPNTEVQVSPAEPPPLLSASFLWSDPEAPCSWRSSS